MRADSGLTGRGDQRIVAQNVAIEPVSRHALRGFKGVVPLASD
jgi:hypothetical protein